MKQRKIYLSLARIICAIAVIMIHTNVCFWEFDLDRCWKSSNIIENALVFAVPVFLMISGATLIDYSDKYSTKEYFKKRINKTVIPFLFWCIIGFIYAKLTGYVGISLVYYFFIYLFGIYLAIPVFSLIKKDDRENIIFYVVITTFIINYFVPFICNIFGISIELGFPFEIAGGYMIYPLVGYLIVKKDIPALWRYISYVCSFVGWGLIIGGTYITSIRTGYIDDTFRGYLNLPAVLVSVGVFIFIKTIGQKIKNEKIICFIEKVSSYTFSVFLLHYYIVHSVINKLFVDTHSLLYRLSVPFVIFLICVILAYFMKKIPFLKKVLP